jgi:hypothetical protein
LGRGAGVEGPAADEQCHRLRRAGRMGNCCEASESRGMAVEGCEEGLPP